MAQWNTVRRVKSIRPAVVILKRRPDEKALRAP
jgi:hypothetical protein